MIKNWFGIFGRFSSLTKNEPSKKENHDSNTAVLEQKTSTTVTLPIKEVIVDIKNIHKTKCLTIIEKDFLLTSIKITEKDYVGLFEDCKVGDHIFPAIDPLFKEALLKEGDLSKIRMLRKFAPYTHEFDPHDYFYSFKKNLSSLSLSAKEIIKYFIENKDKTKTRNWFVWNTKPNEKFTKASDLRFVDIRRTNNGKYYIYCYSCSSWSLRSGGLSEKNCYDMQFIIPIA